MNDVPAKIEGEVQRLWDDLEAPYILPVLPHWKDEYIDRYMHLAFGVYTRNFTPSFRMDEKEALVMLAGMLAQAA